MSRLERFLLLGILFLLFIRLFMMPPDQAAHLDNRPNWERDNGARETGEITPGTGGYDWDPGQFTRRGIPTKLTLTADGKVPDSLRLNDTQKAFVYAAMIETYDSLLTRAHADCKPDIRVDIVRWQARHARTIADAQVVLETLTPGRADRRTVHDKMTASTFAKRVCPTIEHYLATGAYAPHAEAVDRLAHAARGSAGN